MMPSDSTARISPDATPSQASSPLQRRQGRAHVTDDTGWTHVVRSKGQGRRAQHRRPDHRHIEEDRNTQPLAFNKKGPGSNRSEHLQDLSMKKEVLMDTSLNDLRKRHAHFTQRWQISATAETSTGLVRGAFSATRLSVLCLGLGSFASDLSVRGQYRDKDRSLWQLVALESWLGVLKTDDRHQRLQVVFQDPAFTEMDCSFLRDRGYSVRRLPMHEPHVDPMLVSFIFAPCVPTSVVEQALDIAHPPAIIIAHGLETVEAQDTLLSTGKSTSPWQTLQSRYTRQMMPTFERSDWMTGLMLWTLQG